MATSPEPGTEDPLNPLDSVGPLVAEAEKRWTGGDRQGSLPLYDEAIAIARVAGDNDMLGQLLLGDAKPTANALFDSLSSVTLEGKDSL
jgi:hypothetical protein